MGLTGTPDKVQKQSSFSYLGQFIEGWNISQKKK
jgi:hypothetical protein